MGLLRVLRKNNIRPAWRYEPGGILWRVFPSHPDVLVGEERDIERKQVGFFCLERVTGAVRWEKRSFDQQWWISIESVGRDVVFLHRFAQPDMPRHRGIIAVDLQSGEELWRDDALILDRTFSSAILASHISITGAEQTVLHARTGERVEKAGAVDRESTSPLVEAEIEFPDEADGSLEFLGLSPIREHLPSPERLAGPLEVMDLRSRIVVGYHERHESTQDKSPRFRQTLLVGDKASGTILFRDTIAADATGIVPESFFVQGGLLFFVKERRILVAVNLNNGS